MQFYTNQYKFYCGIDLHARKMYICILNSKGDVMVHRNMATNRKQFLHIIEPYREDMAVAVEGIFTWYWIADLCRDNEIPFVLGHALYTKAIHGGKAKNNKVDSHKIAVLLKGGMMPTAYVYPAEMRATRDLLRRRTHFTRKRTELFAHIKNTAHQYNLDVLPGCISKPKNREDHDPVSYTLLKTIPGVGHSFGLTLLYEIENIARFPRVQDFVSYCKLVKCAKESNGKRLGSSGCMIGNAHLKWAFSQAAVHSLKYNEQGKKHLNRLTKKHGKEKALSILAHKIGRATYFILKNKPPFDREKFYGI